MVMQSGLLAQIANQPNDLNFATAIVEQVY